MSLGPDGTLLFAERARGTGTDLFTLSPDGAVAPFLVSPFGKVGGQFSPDGRSVVYVSDETGRDEVYLRSVARPGEVVAVSTEGGRSPRWSPDGKEIFYRRGDSFLVAAVSSTGALSVGDSKRLFEIRAAYGRSTQQAGYAVSPDGRRLLRPAPRPARDPGADQRRPELVRGAENEGARAVSPAGGAIAVSARRG